MVTAKEKQDKLVNQEKGISRMMWLIGIAFTAFLGVGAYQMVSFGAVKNTVETDHAMLDFVSRDYMPAWYGENMVKLMTLHTDRVVAAIKGDNEEVARLNKEFTETTKILNDSFIKSRGGMTTTTRGLVEPTVK